MTETLTSKVFWDPPTTSVGDDGVIYINFRDCLVDIENGLVRSYYDKVQSVLLKPGSEPDSWKVYLPNGKKTGQTWYGIIAFDGSQLLIQQARNTLFRLYKTSGVVETQLRISRLIERSGHRSIVFQQGQTVDEDVAAGTIKVAWGEQTTIRDASGKVKHFDADGEEIDLKSERASVENETLSLFERYLALWQKFSASDMHQEFFYAGPPGLCEAAPGDYFSKEVADKPNDFRESTMHDFGDGTIFYEYVGRLKSPFVAHEVVTYSGAVLARFVEYDQPRSIQFCDARGVVRQFDDVLKVEVQFEPERVEYVTCITDTFGKEYVHPKGATFVRTE